MTVLKLYNRNGYDNELVSPAYTLSNLMNEFFSQDNYLQGSGGSLPKVNIIEEKEVYILSLAIPGINKDDIKILLEKEILTVSHKKEQTENDGLFSRKEFDFGNFERTFHLPETADSQKIKAKYEEGILSIEIPKKKEAIDKGPRDIKIS